MRFGRDTWSVQLPSGWEVVLHGASAPDEDDASLKLDTIAMAEDGATISGDDLYEIIQEAKAKGVTVASLMHKLKNAKTRVLVTPGPGVVEQALRTGRKKGAKPAASPQLKR